MNFLDLCKATRRECSVSGDGPTAITGQSGEMLRIIEWVQSAHQEIQNQWIDWKFLWKEESFNTIASQGTYDLTNQVHMGGASETITDFNEFARFETRDGGGPKIWCGTDQMVFIPWDEYDKNGYPSEGKPYEFTIRPDNQWVLLPTPDAVYTITFEYHRTPLILVDSTDEPLFPVRFHESIVARAMMFYGSYEDASEVFESGGTRYKEAILSLEADQLPQNNDFRFSTNTDIVITVE